MDPNATLQLLLEAIQERDCEGIEYHAQALAQWFDKGGFSCDETALAAMLRLIPRNTGI